MNYTTVINGRPGCTMSSPQQSKETSLIIEAMNRFNEGTQHPSNLSHSQDDDTEYRSLNQNNRVFSEQLFCSVTQSKCKIEDFVVFERADGSLDLVYGVENSSIAANIQSNFPFFPAASGDFSRKIT